MLFVSGSFFSLRAERIYNTNRHPIFLALEETLSPVLENEGVEAAVALLPYFKADMLAEGYSERDIFVHIWLNAQMYQPKTEVSYAIYEWLFIDSVRGDLSGKTMNDSGSILIRLLTTKSRQLGRLAQAERWLQINQLIEEHYLGMVFDLDQYPDLADDIDPAFPGLKRKHFPLRYRDQINASSNAPDFYLHYDHLFVLANLGEHAFCRGDWKTALLYGQWLEGFAESVINEPELWNYQSSNETKNIYSDAMARQTELMWMMGHREEALATLEQHIRDCGAWFYGLHYKREMTAITWRASLGKKVPADYDYLVDEWDDMTQNKFWDTDVMGRKNRITRMWWLYRNDRRDEAVALMEAYFNEDNIPLREDWELYLNMVLMEKDTRPESEEVFMLLLADYRKHGQKIYEPFHYEKYARWLSWQGRWEEVLAIQKEAVRLYTAFEMDEMREKALVLLAEYERLAAEADAPVEETVAPAAKDAIPMSFEAGPAEAYRVDLPPVTVDLQPQLMQSLHAQNTSALALFSLANPGNEVLKGELEVSPALDMKVDRVDHFLSLYFEANAMGGRSRIPLELEAGSLLSLQLESYTRHPEGAKVQLRWQPATDEEGLEAEWNYVVGEGFGKGDFSSAGAYLNNPFYLVPIYQALLRDPSPDAGRIDFRVVASETLRLEVYQLADEQPIYIDDQGDGALDGVGDVLARDNNRNGWPDVDFAPGRVDAGIVIYFLPLPDRKPGPVELNLQIRSGDAWETRAVHTIEFKP